MVIFRPNISWFLGIPVHRIAVFVKWHFFVSAKGAKV